MLDLLFENWQDFMYWSFFACFFMSICFSFSYQWFKWICLKTEFDRLEQPLYQPLLVPVENQNHFFSPLIVWLPKTIRRKESSGEDPDDPHFLRYFQHEMKNLKEEYR